jgi:hypothetical protein
VRCGTHFGLRVGRCSPEAVVHGDAHRLNGALEGWLKEGSMCPTKRSASTGMAMGSSRQRRLVQAAARGGRHRWGAHGVGGTWQKANPARPLVTGDSARSWRCSATALEAGAR